MNKPTFPLFTELKNHLDIEYHIHSLFSDGIHSIEDILHRAMLNRLSGVIFTDHVQTETTWFNEYIKSIEKNRPNDMKVYIGCEAKILDINGAMDLSLEIRNKSEVILGSVHSFRDLEGSGTSFHRLSEKELAYQEFCLACSIIQYGKVDVLAHPGGMYQRIWNKPFPKEYVTELIKLCAKHKVAIEINSAYNKDIPGFINICKEINPKISLGSDCHSREVVGECCQIVKNIIRG